MGYKYKADQVAHQKEYYRKNRALILEKQKYYAEHVQDKKRRCIVHRAYYHRNKHTIRAAYKARRDYNRKFGICEICNKVAQMYKDHDHATGYLRGAICSSCNLMLGHAKEKTEVLISGSNYLKYWS